MTHSQYQFRCLCGATIQSQHASGVDDGHTVWIPMKVEDRRAAFINLRQRFLDTKDVTKVPFPRMHLFARSWERQIIQQASTAPRAVPITCQDCLDAGFLGSDVEAPCDCAAGVRWRELMQSPWGSDRL